MLSSSMLVGAVIAYGRRAYANCVNVSGSNWVCSGSSSAQSISTTNANVATLSGFSVTTGSGTALSITGAGDISYSDAFSSSLTTSSGTGLYVRSNTGSAGSLTINTSGAVTATTFGLTALNNGTGGALAITASGDIAASGSTARGIFAVNRGTDLTVVTAGTVTGRNYGIFARNYGSGETSVTANGDVSALGASLSRTGIFARNSATGTDVSVTTAAGTTVTGNRYGIFALNSGTGALTITAAGDVTGVADNGIYARHSTGGSIAITVDSTSQVTSNGTGASDAAVRIVGGPTTLTVAGALTGGTGGAVLFDQSSALADRLELRPTATINGNVLAGPGTDTLVFGGAGAASFDVAAIGTGLQYQGFETFLKEGSSSWTLTGTNTALSSFTVNGGLLTVSGNMTNTAFTVSAGTLQGSSSGLQADIVDNAAVVFDQATAGTYAGNISGTGSFTKQGAGTLILGGANTYAGGTTVSAGTLQGNTASLQGNIANNAAVVFDQATAGTYAGIMSGTGSLTKQGAGTLNMTGASTYTGLTSVNAGTLAVNGSLASSVTVDSGGTLGGTGTVGGLTVAGGIVAPGNSIGTLTVNGNFVQNGGTYQVEVNAAGQSDRINVGGTATINGGTVQVLAQPGTYARNTTYTIVNATGGVSGAYSTVTSNFAFLSPSLSYDANNVYLLLFQSANAFAAGAQTPNQYAVGTALDIANPNATGDFNSVLNALSALGTTQGPAALDAISGQNYAGFSNAMLQGALLFMNNFSQQVGGGPSGRLGGQRVALAQACDVACDSSPPPLWGAWGGGMGGTGTIAGNGNTGTLTYNVGGFAAGLDRRFAPNLLAGVTLGYQSGTQWTAGFGGRSTIDTFQVGLYASFNQGPLYVDGLAGYAYSSNQMWRNIAIAGLQPRTAQSQTGANQFYGQVETGYRFDLGGAADAFVAPFARLQAYTGTQNAFSETGAQSLNLSVAAQTTNSLRTVLGAQLGGTMDLGLRDKLAAQFRLGWSHEYADTARPVSASFAGAPTVPFTVFGAAPQRDGVVLGLSANTALAGSVGIYLRYEADISGQNSSHALTAGLRMTW